MAGNITSRLLLESKKQLRLGDILDIGLNNEYPHVVLTLLDSIQCGKITRVYKMSCLMEDEASDGIYTMVDVIIKWSHGIGEDTTQWIRYNETYTRSFRAVDFSIADSGMLMYCL